MSDTGFFVLRDAATGKYLKGKRASGDSLAEFGTGVAIYRSRKSAAKAARTAIEVYERLRTHYWPCRPRINVDPVWAETAYGRVLTGIEIVPLSIRPSKVVETVPA